MKRDKKLDEEAGYRLEVSEFVKSTSVMIKLLHDGQRLNTDERKMVRNALELLTTVFDQYLRQDTETP